MPTPAFLTKSRFKLAYQCPTKLYYGEHREYGDLRDGNDFLKSLAEGGFQVGALAKVQYPGGIDLEELRGDEAIARTDELLALERVTLFEAALRVGPYLVRADILEKHGRRVNLIEVKAKAYGFPIGEGGFFKKRGDGIDGEWEPYLVDVAFQKWVAERYFGERAEVIPFLMLADKNAVTTVDGLHQRFFIRPLPGGRSTVVVREGTTKESCGAPILRTIDVAKETSHLIGKHLFPGDALLPEYAAFLADCLARDGMPAPEVSSLCKSCEFRIGEDAKARGVKSGFERCAVESGALRPRDLGKPLIFGIWDLKAQKTQELLEQGKIFVDQIESADLGTKGTSGLSKSKRKPSGLSRLERQMLQVNMLKDGETASWIDRDGLRGLFEGVKYPLHCIDFETTAVAIPFHRGRRPYEQIAFQFSHHFLREDGAVAKADPFLHTAQGEFPNFEFVRALRRSLSGDAGTIFRYADHENTVLRQILRQLAETPARELPDDSGELREFIVEVTQATGSEGSDPAPGPRMMRDLRKIVLNHYYHPLMGGSNSIKKVIPAVLAESTTLQAKYPAWIRLDGNGKPLDPYSLLPPMMADVEQRAFDDTAGPLLVEGREVKDGGSAMTAWARLQFTEMSEAERRAVREALLRYCELDTLSMIWILEHFRELAGKEA